MRVICTATICQLPFGRVQTVVTWPSAEDGLVNVVITNDLPDPKIQAAVDAFAGG